MNALPQYAGSMFGDENERYERNIWWESASD